MKKIISLLAVFLFTTAFIFSAEQLKQYQTFNWSKVEKASKYGVEVEQKEKDGKWTSVVSEKTTECNLEVLLFPGDYRVSITTYNVLGKKASSTDWVEFTILDESEPFIFEDSFTVNKTYKVPVMNFKLEDDYIVYCSENTISAIDDYIDNSFFLTGKNFFFPETKFYLSPKARSVNGLQGEPFVEGRAKSELSILRRDRERNGIYLSYTSEDLYTGYYDLIIENPGNNKCSKEILVIAERAPSFIADSSKLNKRYLAVNETVERDDNAVLNISGAGFNAGTVFEFIPVTDGVEYPFTSSLTRSSVKASVANGKASFEKGVLNVTLNFSSKEMQTGYYNLTATNADGTSCSEKLLVTVKEKADVIPEITEVTSKQKKNNLEITITGQRFAADTKLTLVGEVVEASGLNKKIPVTVKDVKKDGKKIECTADVSSLKAGTYALLLESKTASLVSFIKIDSSFNSSLNTLSESSIEQSFFRAEQKEAAVQSVTTSSKKGEKPVYQIKSGASSSFSSSDGSWVSLYEGTSVINEYAFYGCTNIGTLMIPDTVFNIRHFAFSLWENTQTIILNWNPGDGAIHGISDYAFAGCNAVIRYRNGELYSVKHKDYIPGGKEFSDNSSLEYPEDYEKWMKFFTIADDTLTITSEAAWDFKNYWKKENNFAKVIVTGNVTYVCDYAFEGCTSINEVILSDSVRSVGNYAFKNCSNLVSITMADNAHDPTLSVIVKQPDILLGKDGVFYGCQSLQKINYINGKYIPGLYECVSRIPKKMKYSNRLVFPYVEAAVGVTTGDSENLHCNADLNVDVINFRDIAALQFSASGPFTTKLISMHSGNVYSSENFFKLGGKAMVGIPGNVFHPYVSAGFLAPVEIQNVTVTGSTGRGILPEMYIPFEAGIMIGGVLDIKYSLALSKYPYSTDFPNGTYAFERGTETVSLGIRIPLGKKKNIGFDSTRISFLNMNSTCKKICFEYDSEKSEYNYIQDISEEVGTMLKSKTDVTLQWTFVSNVDINELKVYLVDTSEKAGGWSVLTNKKYLWIKNIKAGIPIKLDYDITTDVKSKENVSLYMRYDLDAASEGAILKVISK